MLCVQECEEVLEIFTNRLVALDPDSLASELCVRVVTVFCQVSASWLVVKYFLINVKYFSAGAGAAPGPGPEAGDPPAGLSAQQRHRSGGFKHCQVSGGE